MARERKASEVAITNMLSFLTDLKEFAETPHETSITRLCTQNHVSQSAALAVKNLGIIAPIENTRQWVYRAKNPDRQLALIVLDAQLQKNKPGAYTPLFPDMAKMVALLEEISSKLSSTPQIENNGLGGFKTSDKTFEVFKAVTTGVYSKVDLHSLSGNSIAAVNSDILLATEDLLKQYNQKFI